MPTTYDTKIWLDCIFPTNVKELPTRKNILAGTE